jgi:hypothetical protein
VKYFQVKVEAAGSVKVIAPEAQVFVTTFQDKSAATKVAVAACAQTGALAIIGAVSVVNKQDVLVHIFV